MARGEKELKDLECQVDGLLAMPDGIDLSKLSVDERVTFIELYQKSGGGIAASKPHPPVDLDQLREDLIAFALKDRDKLEAK